MNTAPGSIIDRKYELLEPLAEGGMGSVYRARHVLTEERVALKILNVGPADVSQARRFKLEVSIAAKVKHPAIVKVRDAGMELETGRFYIAMELLEGRDLRDALDDGVDPATALGWLVQALDAIAAAHEQSVIHRDLKPDNLFIETTEAGERLRVLDFGIARDISGPSATTTGVAVGTALYMSPEQATAAKDIGPAADVWAFGAMIYEVLTGRPPFDGPSAHAVVIGAVTEPHQRLTDLRPDLDGRWSNLIDRCLAKRADDRPTARELAAALQTLLCRPLGLESSAARSRTHEIAGHSDVAIALVTRSPRDVSAYAMTAPTAGQEIARSRARATASEATTGLAPIDRPPAGRTPNAVESPEAPIDAASESDPPPPPANSRAPLFAALALAAATGIGLWVWFSRAPHSSAPEAEPRVSTPAETASASAPAAPPDLVAAPGPTNADEAAAPGTPSPRSTSGSRRRRSPVRTVQPAPEADPARADPDPERSLVPEPAVPDPGTVSEPAVPTPEPDPIPEPAAPAPSSPDEPPHTSGSERDHRPSGVLQGTDAFDRQAGRR